MLSDRNSSAIVADLAAKGVAFDHYPGIARFRGNILHVNQIPDAR